METWKIIGSVNARTVFDENTGEIIIDANEIINEERWKTSSKWHRGCEILKMFQPENTLFVTLWLQIPLSLNSSIILYATMRPEIHLMWKLLGFRLFFDRKV